jgi:hypothetical protein
MQSLKAIVQRASLPVPDFHLDHFQRRVLQDLHLEFFFARCRVMITPSLGHFATGEVASGEEAQLRAILDQSQDLVEQLKRYLIYSLSAHSALLETNSYFIAVNDHLVIARFVGLRDRGEEFEVKLYTLRPSDLPERYADKIYLGRDFLRLDRLERDHFGLRDLRDSLREQAAKLKGRLERHAPDAVRAGLETEYLGDLRELTEEFSRKADEILGGFPPSLREASDHEETLLEVSRRFRELKHVLLDADAVLQEMEERLFDAAPHAARYVTKLRKDVTNDVNYIMLKVNGRITDAVNAIRL